MEGHDLFTQAETDTRASGFGCEKRNEDFIQSFRDDARSVVLDVDGDLSGVGLGGDADQGSRYIRQASSAFRMRLRSTCSIWVRSAWICRLGIRDK